MKPPLDVTSAVIADRVASFSPSHAGDRFLLCDGVSLYHRPFHLYGLENLWIDIYDEPENLERLLDVLTDMNLTIIERCGKLGFDGFISCDD